MSSTYIDFRKEHNKKYPEFEVGYHVRMSKYKRALLQKNTLN